MDGEIDYTKCDESELVDMFSRTDPRWAPVNYRRLKELLFGGAKRAKAAYLVGLRRFYGVDRLKAETNPHGGGDVGSIQVTAGQSVSHRGPHGASIDIEAL